MHWQVWAVPYIPEMFTDDLYQLGLVQVDLESQARIRRFYHRADACRALLGRLLPRALLKQRGVRRDQIAFGKTDAGKPFISTIGLEKTIGFNVSHDHSLVIMAYQIHEGNQGNVDVCAIGIDTMKVALPRYEKTLEGFVSHIADSLTALERRLLLDPAISHEEGLRRLFLIWTMKEAYTKALGLGLGFDFRRIEYNTPENRLLIDGAELQGWEFLAFPVQVQQEKYQVVVAKLVGGDDKARVDVREHHEGDWFVQHDISSIINFPTGESLEPHNCG